MTPRELVTSILEDKLPDTIVVIPYARDGIVPTSPDRKAMP